MIPAGGTLPPAGETRTPSEETTMSYMGNAMVELAEAGAVMAEMDEVRSWRAAGHDVPLVWVDIDTYRGRRPMPAIALDVAERLAGSLEDAEAREGLRQAVADARGYREMVGRDRDCAVLTAAIRREATSAAATARRLAGEIVAAVAAGEELPEEWHRLDAYAGVGEPVAEEVCRLVRDDLEGTGIRP
jgi:hypothetical protein